MDFLAELELRTRFPELQPGDFEITSPETPNYNCIAWAVGDVHKWWWPDGINYWPPSAPKARTVEAFVRVFEALGYTKCETADLEEGYEKIAIFAGPSGTPKHAARQLSDGRWTSKLGKLHDIEHELEQVGGTRGESYGNVIVVMRRKRK